MKVALVIQEPSDDVIRVIIVPEDQVPQDIDDLAAYGNQRVNAVSPDFCETADEVRAIFDEMNPPSEDET